MLDGFMGKCSPNSALLPIKSLNEIVPTDDGTDLHVEIGDTIIDPSPSVEEKIDTEREIKLLHQFVQGLSPSLRCIALRSYWKGHSNVEIARDLGVDPSAISHALRRIRRLGFRKLAPVFQA